MLLVAEKTSLRRDWAEACRRLGCSGILLGGQPSLLETEFLAEPRGIRADHLGAEQVLELVARNCPSGA